jgi:uncharacterized SAM-binding protein YcdF (DUF218 family)
MIWNDMAFSLPGILGFFALPSNFLVVLALLGIVLMLTPLARAGRNLAVFGILMIAICGWLPVGNLLMAPLEQRFPKWDGLRGAPDGIVVLGGAISPDVSSAHREAALNESAERMTVVAELARRFPKARIVFTGGEGRLTRGATEADYALRMFESFGIARERIELESEARNTVENAMLSKALANPKYGERWLLVTSAHHMPRAMGIFRQAGFPVEAYPVDFRTRGAGDLVGPFGSIAAGLARTDAAAREWAGLPFYWLAGRTPDLFPGP